MALSLDRLARTAGLTSAAVVFPDVNRAPSPNRGPSRRATLGEAATPLQVLRLLAATPRLRHVPRAPGSAGSQVVVDVPGWKAPEASGAPLRAFLRHLGYDARGWGLGTNRGDPAGDATRLAARVLELAEQRGPVALVGWSLGGVIVREVARAHPEAVTRVITYGTPVVGGPRWTSVAALYSENEAKRVARVSAEIDRANPLRVPVTVILSRRDGIVAWPASVDRSSTDVEHIEVGSTHLGLGVDPDVWEIVAARLARPISS